MQVVWHMVWDPATVAAVRVKGAFDLRCFDRAWTGLWWVSCNTVRDRREQGSILPTVRSLVPSR